MQSSITPKYSFVIPVYDEEKTILELYRRVVVVMEQLNESVELILVNDGSRDRSLQLMRDLRQKDPRICYLSLVFCVCLWIVEIIIAKGGVLVDPKVHRGIQPVPGYICRLEIRVSYH